MRRLELCLVVLAVCLLLDRALTYPLYAQSVPTIEVKPDGTAVKNKCRWINYAETSYALYFEVTCPKGVKIP